MKKADFFSLITGVIGGAFFALGMCMCLVSEWNAFKFGVIMGIIGLIILIAMIILRRRMQGKPAFRLSKKTAGIIALSTVGAIVLGVGMCMCMVWNKMILGVIIGLIGILVLLCLIPLCKGLK